MFSSLPIPLPASAAWNAADARLLGRCPRLVRVQGHPVYVAPELALNCFYVDGCYWLLPDDGEWRRCPDFDGRWQRIENDHVPMALLRLPLSAYRAPPARLCGDAPYRPPRWDLIWGPEWARRHAGWARRDAPAQDAAAPRPAAQQAQELQRGLLRRPALPTDFLHTEEHT